MASQPPAKPPATPAQQQPQKPPKRRRSGCTIWLFVLVFLILSVIGFGFFRPATLAIAQELVIGITRGGILITEEKTWVESCILDQETNELVSVPRTRRETKFNNGSVLEITFSDPPLPADCRQ
jgi:hypothetical protein